METKQLEPTIAAMIMAFGIYIYGPIERISFFNNRIGILTTVALLIVWVVMYARLSFSFLFRKSYRNNMLIHPIQSFAMGTWIAGASVLCNVLVKYLPYLPILTKTIAIINIGIWIGFLILVIVNFIKLHRSVEYVPVHGIILLSAVGTQSISILINQVFTSLTELISSIIIITGLLFYVIGLYFIVKRYIRRNSWNIIHDWNNTNCIIHGALSITGLAIVTMDGLSSNNILFFWLFVCIILILIELIEIIRMTLRIIKLGINEAIFTYDVSQWARNFTFGMFYVFTEHLLHNQVYTVPTKVSNMLIQFNSIWAILITFLLFYEIILYIKQLFAKKQPDLSTLNTFD